MTVVTGRWW